MKKRHMIVSCAAALVLLTALAIYWNRAVIFQRGNPVPYLTAAIQISDKKPYVPVDETSGIYISKRGECPALFDYFQQEIGAKFVEQAGSGYLFTDGTRNYVISSEIYLGRYTVWTLPAPDVLVLSGNIDNITVEYIGGGQIKKWSMAVEQIDEVIGWFSRLDYRRVEFEEGGTPADGEGQAVYSLTFSDGVQFAYYDCGPDHHYIRTQNHWYLVENPTLPPVGMPV